MTSWYRVEKDEENPSGTAVKLIENSTGTLTATSRGTLTAASIPVPYVIAQDTVPPVKRPRGRPRKADAGDKTAKDSEVKPKAKPRTKAQGHDSVEAPSHYCKGGFELGPILYAWGLSHRRASAVEYIMRAGAKESADEVEDLKKAIRNLQMEIEYMEKYGKIR